MTFSIFHPDREHPYRSTPGNSRMIRLDQRYGIRYQNREYQIFERSTGRVTYGGTLDALWRTYMQLPEGVQEASV